MVEILNKAGRGGVVKSEEGKTACLKTINF